MAIKVKLAPALQEYFNAPGVIEVSGNTLEECLQDLIRQYPEARNRLFAQDGVLRVMISLNNGETVVPDRNGLVRTMNTDDELQIAAVVGGG